MLPASQGKTDEAGYNQTCAWRAGEDACQNQHDNQTTSYFKTTLNSNEFPHVRSEDQIKALHPQRSNLQFPLTKQVSQNFQMPMQIVHDSYQTNRMQIPTSLRIAKHMGFGVNKTHKKSIKYGETLKPASIIDPSIKKAFVDPSIINGCCVNIMSKLGSNLPC